MTMFLINVICVLIAAVAILAYFKHDAERRMEEALKKMDEARRERDLAMSKAREELQGAIAFAQTAFDQKIEELECEAEKVRQHYEGEAQRVHQESSQSLATALQELESLRVYGSLRDAETDVRKTLAEALEEAHALRAEAQSLSDEAGAAARRESDAIIAQATTLLAQANRDASKLLAEADRKAEQIGRDAYRALQEHEHLLQAIQAIRNVVEGYGDRYVVPTHSLLDDLAEGFSHTNAGQALRVAREQSRIIVEERRAAACDYAEENRRETAVRFVIDAFNGSVDAILSTVRHNNHGTLEQQIRDAFARVNINGEAFRNARITEEFLNACLAELKWAVAAQELKQREREEQREIRERIREEEKARRDYERAVQEAAREEEALKRAMEKARAEAEQATAQEKAALELQMAELATRLKEAEEKNQRAISMAQQTKAGHIYIISNIGSFDEEVFKIGMTRRLDPMDRIWELGDASVPFDFDVHAMIYSEDAPALERMLHQTFGDLRVNRVNYRKEFFRLPIERLRAAVADRGLEVTFTMVAEAREYRETLVSSERPRLEATEPSGATDYDSTPV